MKRSPEEREKVQDENAHRIAYVVQQLRLRMGLAARAGISDLTCPQLSFMSIACGDDVAFANSMFFFPSIS